MSIRLVTGAATHVGRVRDVNEDAYLVDKRIGLVAVADGMGGHQAGEVASATAMDALRVAVDSGTPVGDAVVRANEAVYTKAATDSRLRGMGTTLTAGTVVDGTLVLGHVGDSRAYMLRDGELQQLTADHSVVAELVEAGQLTEQQAEFDPRRSMITRALGIEPTVEVDVVAVPLRDGDRILLCSDGLTTMVREDVIATLLRRERDPERAARALVDAANAAGGIDNTTVVVVDVHAADADHEAADADHEAADAGGDVQGEGTADQPGDDDPGDTDNDTDVLAAEPEHTAAKRPWWRRVWRR